MKMTVRVDGLRELDAALGELPKATARRVLLRTLSKAGKPIAERAAELAPDDPQTGSPDLRTSIIVSAKLKNPVGAAEFAAVMKAGGSRAEAGRAMAAARKAQPGGSFAMMFVGPSARQFHAHMQEFGTVHHGPQPFMRPAWDEKAQAALEVIKTTLGDEIEKTAARIAKRAAAKAAKGK